MFQCKCNARMLSINQHTSNALTSITVVEFKYVLCMLTILDGVEFQRHWHYIPMTSTHNCNSGLTPIMKPKCW